LTSEYRQNLGLDRLYIITNMNTDIDNDLLETQRNQPDILNTVKKINAITFPTDFVEIFSLEQQISTKFAFKIMKEYKKFLFLLKISGDQWNLLKPSYYVAQAWFLHMQNTKNYHEELLELEMRHTYTPEKKSKEGLNEKFDHTTQTYLRYFKKLSKKIWLLETADNEFGTWANFTNSDAPPARYRGDGGSSCGYHKYKPPGTIELEDDFDGEEQKVSEGTIRTNQIFQPLIPYRAEVKGIIVPDVYDSNHLPRTFVPGRVDTNFIGGQDVYDANQLPFTLGPGRVDTKFISVQMYMIQLEMKSSLLR